MCRACMNPTERTASSRFRLALCAVCLWLPGCGSSLAGDPTDAGGTANVDAGGTDSGASDEALSDASIRVDGTKDETGSTGAGDSAGDRDGAAGDDGGLPRCAPLSDGKGNLELK